MTNTMYIGSGDVAALLSGKGTKTHAKLLQRFVSGLKPIYNAYNSPIDALRTGQILEDRFSLIVEDGFYPQYHSVCEELNVLKASLDFAKIENGNVVDFIELKTKWFAEYIKLGTMSDVEKMAYVLRYHKANYNQVQEQLLCTGLESGRLGFLAVYSYEDEINYARDIKEGEYMFITIERDEAVIEKIKSRAKPFQQIKDYYA